MKTQDQFKLLEFPHQDRVYNCLQTVLESFRNDEYSIYYMELFLEEVIDMFDNDPRIEVIAIQKHLLNALLTIRYLKRTFEI